MSLCKQIIGVTKTTSNKNVLAELCRLLFKIYVETQMFKYSQHFRFLEENTYLRKVINEDSGRMANLKYILYSYGLSNLMTNIFKIVDGA